MDEVDGNPVGDDGGVSAESAGGGVVETFLRRTGAMLLARRVFVIVVRLGVRWGRDIDRQLVKSASVGLWLEERRGD